VAQSEGYPGSETQWLASLKGTDGQPYGNMDGGKADSMYGGINSILGGNAGSF
jgi:hypothetical protein